MFPSHIYGTTEDSTIWFCKDREGILTASLAQILLLLAFLLSDILLLPSLIAAIPLLRLTQFFMLSLYITCFYCHIKCVFTNPGAVPHNAHPLPMESMENGELLRRCGICNAFKPSNSHHCKVCNRCILRMDHHCPWINNCVGMMNMKFFLLFCIYSIVFCIIVFILSCTTLSHILHIPKQHNHILSAIEIVHLCCILSGVLIPLFFIIFGTIIVIDAMKTALSGKTKIDRKREDIGDRAIQEGCSEVFGGDGAFSVNWLIPTIPTFKTSLGYELHAHGERWNIYETFIVCYRFLEFPLFK